LPLNFSEYFTQFHYKELAVCYSQSAVAYELNTPKPTSNFPFKRRLFCSEFSSVTFVWPETNPFQSNTTKQDPIICKVGAGVTVRYCARSVALRGSDL